MAQIYRENNQLSNIGETIGNTISNVRETFGSFLSSFTSLFVVNESQQEGRVQYAIPVQQPQPQLIIYRDQAQICAFVDSSLASLLTSCASSSPSSPGGGDGNGDDRDRIVAAIVSGLAIAGGVTLIFVAGPAGAGTILCTSLLISSGSAGLVYTMKEDFSWAEWGREVATAAGITLITFGASYATGGLLGLALVGRYTEAQVRLIGAIGGAVVGAGVRTGTFVIICKYRGEKVSAFKLVITALEGALEGAIAGYQGARIEACSAVNQQVQFEVELDKNSSVGIGSERPSQGSTVAGRGSTPASEPMKVGNVIKSARDGKLTTTDVKSWIDQSNLRRIRGEFGHSNIHIVDYESMWGDEFITTPIRNGGVEKISSYFSTPDQQVRLAHEAMTSPEGIKILENLNKTGNETLIYNTKNAFK